MKNTPQKYIAFISYRYQSVSARVAFELHRHLEHYTIPKPLRKNGKKRIGRIFLDTQEFPATADLFHSIKQALDQSEYLILVCTPEIHESKWVMAEIKYFLEHHAADHVLTVLLRGRPEESFPIQIMEIRNATGQVIQERIPLAANIVSDTLRGSLRILRREKLRLLAGILGCSYDDLINRDLRWRRKRLRMILVIVIMLALAFISMLIYKNWQIRLQLAQTELRESEALTYIALDYLTVGDRTHAIQALIDALPTQDKQRPFYPPAQAGLVDGLQIYHDRAVAIDRTFTHGGKIGSFMLSEDQTTAYIMDWDTYSLSAYDIETGEKIWTYSGELFCTTIYPLKNRKAILCCGTEGFIVLDQQSGSVLCAQDVDNFSMDMGCILLPEKAWVAYTLQDHLLIYEVRQHIELVADIMFPEFAGQSIQTYMGSKMDTSEHEDRLLFTLWTSTDSTDFYSQEYQLFLMSYDLEEKSMKAYPVLQRANTCLGIDYDCGYTPDGNTYVVYTDCLETEPAIHIKIFDLNGSLLHSCDVSLLQLNTPLLYPYSLLTYQQENLLIGTYGSTMFAFDLSSRSLSWNRSLEANCLALSPRSTGSCNIVLHNGTISTVILHNGQLPLVEGELLYHSKIALQDAFIGEGTDYIALLQPDENDNMLLSARLTNGAFLSSCKQLPLTPSSSYRLTVDENGNQFICNRETSELLTALNLPQDVRLDENVQIQIIPEDQAFLIFDTEKASSLQNGYCIDIPTGQIKAVIPGLAGFDPDRNYIYRYRYNSLTFADELAIYPYFSLEKLLNIAYSWQSQSNEVL